MHRSRWSLTFSVSSYGSLLERTQWGVGVEFLALHWNDGPFPVNMWVALNQDLSVGMSLVAILPIALLKLPNSRIALPVPAMFVIHN